MYSRNEDVSEPSGVCQAPADVNMSDPTESRGKQLLLQIFPDWDDGEVEREHSLQLVEECYQTASQLLQQLSADVRRLFEESIPPASVQSEAARARVLQRACGLASSVHALMRNTLEFLKDVDSLEKKRVYVRREAFEEGESKDKLSDLSEAAAVLSAAASLAGKFIGFPWILLHTVFVTYLALVPESCSSRCLFRLAQVEVETMAETVTARSEAPRKRKIECPCRTAPAACPFHPIRSRLLSRLKKRQGTLTISPLVLSKDSVSILRAVFFVNVQGG
eukprot:GHVU01111731.1.p1 GENE.GHVU01111731.1~~GHVU01111731.1.p1  ORF type:complete len:278 (+),score=29.07 GHVU01111731.1:108-941(+)